MNITMIVGVVRFVTYRAYGESLGVYVFPVAYAVRTIAIRRVAV